MQAPISVGELNEQIKSLLETTFLQVSVEGELSRITHHNSGHIYFTLKDKNSAISGVMFRGNASRLKFRLEEGLKVVIQGAITLFKPRGTYQINAFSIEPSGHGVLALAYEQLKADLSASGYFDTQYKKEIPDYPSRIALVTSATGAALQDMLRVHVQRWPLCEMMLIDTIVQGEGAAYKIASALEFADDGSYDVIVVGRGGGSLEDLWAFNERHVAEAIFNCSTPVVSAVGHEIDYLISDLVADLRAPTPSAAMQLILPDQNEVMMHLDSLSAQMSAQMSHIINRKSIALTHLHESYKRNSIEMKLINQLQEIEQLKNRLSQSFNMLIENKRRLIEPLRSALSQQSLALLQSKSSQITNMRTMLEAQNPKTRVHSGFVQLSKSKKSVALKSVKVDDEIELMDTEFKVSALVQSKLKI